MQGGLDHLGFYFKSLSVLLLPKTASLVLLPFRRSDPSRRPLAVSPHGALTLLVADDLQESSSRVRNAVMGHSTGKNLTHIGPAISTGLTRRRKPRFSYRFETRPCCCCSDSETSKNDPVGSLPKFRGVRRCVSTLSRRVTVPCGLIENTAIVLCPRARDSIYTGTCQTDELAPPPWTSRWLRRRLSAESTRSGSPSALLPWRYS